MTPSPDSDSWAPRTFDLEQMRAQLELEDPYLVQIVDLFLQGLPDRRLALDRAVTARRTEEVCRLAHTLRGTASNFVASGLSEAAAELEALARDGDVEGLEACRAVVFGEMALLEEALRRFRNRTAAQGGPS